MGKPAPAPKPKPVGKPAPAKKPVGKPAPAPKPAPAKKMSYLDAAKKGHKANPGPAKKRAPAKKATSSKGEAKPGGKGEVTRATNLMRARKCQELLPEWQKAYASSIPI